MNSVPVELSLGDPAATRCILILAVLLLVRRRRGARHAVDAEISQRLPHLAEQRLRRRRGRSSIYSSEPSSGLAALGEAHVGPALAL